VVQISMLVSLQKSMLLLLMLMLWHWSICR
jgi:hypothetical protein